MNYQEANAERLEDLEQLAFDLFSRGQRFSIDQIKECLELTKCVKGEAVWGGLMKQTEWIYMKYENTQLYTPELAFTEAVARNYEKGVVPVGMKIPLPNKKSDNGDDKK
jgi:hypothetical protein